MSDNFREEVEKIIKVEHDEITDDECIDRICTAALAMAERMPKVKAVPNDIFSSSYQQGLLQGINEQLTECQAHIREETK